jgi:hypothetical protein
VRAELKKEIEHSIAKYAATNHPTTPSIVVEAAALSGMAFTAHILARMEGDAELTPQLIESVTQEIAAERGMTAAKLP